MQIPTTYLKKYNHPSTVVLVASFPGKKDRSIKQIDAVASYTDHLSKYFGKALQKRKHKLVILAQKIDGKEECYQENGVLIARVWDKGSLTCYISLIRALRKLNNVFRVMIQFEFHQFGGNVQTGLFPLFLSILRIMNKQITLIMHQVVEDITTLSGHVNISPDSKRAWVFNYALQTFYKATAMLTQQIVVHNTILAERFTHITGRKQIAVIPHGVGAISSRVKRALARKSLGYTNKDTVIMYFGFLTWYKGADWLVKAWKTRPNKNYKLLLAGGESPNLMHAKHYKHYTKHLSKAILTTPGITCTGFVEDKDLANYFAAADLVVLPYRSLMSSSGPLAMTIAFKKPFIMSNKLDPYTRDPDFSSIVPTFALREQDFWQTIQRASKDLSSLKRFSEQLYTTRHWKTVSERFAAIITKKLTTQATSKPAIIQKKTPVYAAPSLS